jgi:hypothetical protein
LAAGSGIAVLGVGVLGVAVAVLMVAPLGSKLVAFSKLDGYVADRRRDADLDLLLVA